MTYDDGAQALADSLRALLEAVAKVQESNGGWLPPHLLQACKDANAILSDMMTLGVIR